MSEYELELPDDWKPIRDAEGRVVGGWSDQVVDLASLFEPPWARSRWAYRRARFRFGLRLGTRWPHRLGVALGLRYSPSLSAMMGPMPARRRNRT